MGHGVVGTAVAEILLEHWQTIYERTGERLELAAVCDLRDFSHLEYANLFTKDAIEMARDPSIQVFVECMGGVEPARRFVTEALRHKKHVVTSNKALVAAAGDELIQLANEMGVRFLYEASVGGGIPLLNPIRQSLAANRLTSVIGILNGTTNYILTRMTDEGASFDASLKEAQALGYAEADPSADIDGDDARRKICILAHVAFGAKLDDSKIFTDGIRRLTVDDVSYARRLGCAVKLVAETDLTENGWRALVTPAMLPENHPLSSVSGVFNAVLVRGNMVGDVLFYGRGAGARPTASAIVGDIVDIALHPGDPTLCPENASLSALPALSGEARLFTRLMGEQEAVFAAVAAALPDAQLLLPEGNEKGCGLLTPLDEEAKLRAAIDALGFAHGAILRCL